jgi:3-methylcrotonyl-CoA carboxylase alpha subunit
VPLTPGYHGDRQEPDYLLEQARRIGFPVLIKAVSGGGGKGMRRVDSADDFVAALASCQREAQASFGDARVLVERYLTTARHIEVQVFGDNHGNAVYLFERDCSVQRRHQKVIEEAPAPGMTPERRRQMGEAAVAAARAVKYSGAGTVEFIAAPDGAFYFMEMNTRLQVEHPVTEMITGLDLVEWQLRVAAGEKLPLAQEQLAIRGHAIEARVYAEDPARDFLPSIGRLAHLATPPTDASVRIDTGVRQGDEITPYYDPMIAKLIVHGDTRTAAIERMRTALAAYEIVGVQTNVEFLGRLMTAPSYVNANLDTALIERERAHLFPERGPASRLHWDLGVFGFVAARRAATVEHEPASPWASRDGWRLVGSARRNWKFTEGGNTRDVEAALVGETVHVTIDGVTNVVSNSHGAGVHADGKVIHVFVGGEHRVFEWLDPYLPVQEHVESHGGLRAPMPGRILAVMVEPGVTVKRGAPLVVMEAMKMEHTVVAPAAGVVDRVLCAVGEQVKEGVELLEFKVGASPA